MPQSSGYEIGGSSYRSNLERGQWSRETDFMFASVGQAFKIELVTWLFPFMVLRSNVWCILEYLLGVAVFVVPLVLLQSYLGQFSSSSYISVFRISPLFKGIGYVSLVLNFALLGQQSIFAGTPLLFLLNSMRPVLPWSCEAFDNRPQKSTEYVNVSFCNTHQYLGPHNHSSVTIPSIYYLNSHYEHGIDSRLSFSWTLFACMLGCWFIVGLIVQSSVGLFGKIIRILVMTTSALLAICLFCSLFLDGSMYALLKYFDVSFERNLWPLLMPVTVVTTFGLGWGTTITMASFNRFNTNILHYSWLICGLQVLVMVLFGMLIYLLDTHMRTKHNLLQGLFSRDNWQIMLSIPSALADLGFAHLWSIIYFTMLVLAAVVIMSTNVYSMIVALQDEFRCLQHHHSRLSISVVSSLALYSSLYSVNLPRMFSLALTTDGTITQTSFNMLLLLVVLWVYGRKRFQRDFEFMLGRPFRTWIVHIVRFVPLICGAIVLWFCYLAAWYQHSFDYFGFELMFLVMVVLPWLFIPGFIVTKMLQTSGSARLRIRRIARPFDWFPMRSEDRQRYLDMLGNMDLSQQLKESEPHNPENCT